MQNLYGNYLSEWGGSAHYQMYSLVHKGDQAIILVILWLSKSKVFYLQNKNVVFNIIYFHYLMIKFYLRLILFQIVLVYNFPQSIDKKASLKRFSIWLT